MYLAFTMMHCPEISVPWIFLNEKISEWTLERAVLQKKEIDSFSVATDDIILKSDMTTTVLTAVPRALRGMLLFSSTNEKTRV